MNDAPRLVLSLAAGCVLGAVFYGGLWWTVRRGVSSPRPAAWFLTSLVVRTLVAVLGFYLVSGGDLRRLLACLAGFVVARVAVTRIAAAPPGPAACAAKEGGP